MNKLKWKGGALIAPLPAVMVSCADKDGNGANIITVAWTGIINTVPPKTYISVRPKRHSYNLIKESGEFTINLTSVSLAKATDFCGMYTGRKVDKFQKCGLTAQEGSENRCPMIAECPISLECKVTDVIPMGTHDMFLADIVATHVREDLIDASGKLHMEKADLMAYAHGEYFSLGKRLGVFGFSAVKNTGKQGKRPHTDKK